MGRWAQAQRRGGFANFPAPPPIDCANVVLLILNVDGNTQYRIQSVAGVIPPGVTGIAYAGGVEDCTETDGQVAFSSLPSGLLLSVPGEDQDAFFQFAWVFDGAIQPFGCDCTQVGP